MILFLLFTPKKEFMICLKFNLLVRFMLYIDDLSDIISIGYIDVILGFHLVGWNVDVSRKEILH